MTDTFAGTETANDVPIEVASTSTVTTSGNAMFGALTVTSGTVNLGSGNIQIDSLTQTGGILNSTSGVLTTVQGNISLTGGTYNHSNGKLVFNGYYNTLTANGFTFYDLVLQNPLGASLSGNMNVAHNLFFDTPSAAINPFTGGNITMTGAAGSIIDVRNGAGNDFYSGITINSPGTITLASSGTSLSAIVIQAGTLDCGSGNLLINASLDVQGGTFKASSGTTYFYGNFNTMSMEAGTFNANGGTFNLYAQNHPSISGAFVFNNLNFLGSGGVFGLNTGITTVGTLTFNFTGGWSSNNLITALGNVVNASNATAPGYFPTLLFSGTAAQTYSGAAAFKNDVSVNKASGVVTLSSNLTQNGNTTTVTSGTLDLGAASMRAQRRCASGAKDLSV